MKKLSLIFILFLIISCRENKKISISQQNLISENQDTIIENVSKNCKEAQERNIYDYYLCRDWKILDPAQIKKIVKSGELGDGGESDARMLHYASAEFPIWIESDMTIGKHKYKLKINGGSYFYLTNDKNITLLYFCKKNKWRSFFISGIGVEDDELYEKLKVNSWDKVKSTKPDLKEWEGNYNFDNGNFEQSYRSYHVKIESNICIFYQGDLPACEIECISDNYGNELNLYIKSDEFKKSQYDISLVESLSEGDYLLKIIKKNHKIFIQSPLIKYWNSKSNTFEKNIEIEAQIDSKFE
ncbi:hypothetical protein [Flavobacterium johnsoniae]|uniref:hypothetical protein n=1 Tax=Flavobacterium johnsoniae TaxID=986 RepID=UPI003D996118